MRKIKTQKLAAQDQVAPIAQPNNPQQQQQQQQMNQPQQQNMRKMTPEELQAFKGTLSLLRTNFPDLVPMLKNSMTRPYVIKILSAIADPDSLVNLKKILGKINQYMEKDQETTEQMLQQA